MEWVTIARMLSSRTDFDILPDLLRDHLRKNMGEQTAAQVSVEYQTFDKHAEIRCTFYNDGKKTAGRRSEFLAALSAGVADYIVNVEEKFMLRRLLSQEYGYGDEQDIGKIMAFSGQSPPADSPIPAAGDKKRQRAAISKEIHRLWKEMPEMNLDGLVRFRLQDYREELGEIAEYAVDEFLMDKQYQEFISLLKYFVFIQQAKTPAAHLMHKGGSEFLLLDEEMRPMDTAELDGTFTVEMLDKEVNFEDLIVSTLITVAPRQIYIHTREPEVQIVKTIRQIFEDRARICRCCRHCQPLLGDFGGASKS